MSQTDPDIVLSARGLTKAFAGFKAVNDVDLDVRRGTIHALIGPNGAGKTTVFNLLTKFLTPTAGRIVFDGRDITRLKPADVARLGLVRSFQISAIFPNVTVLNNVRLALQRKAGLGMQFWRSGASLESLHDEAHRLVEAVGLTAYASDDAGDLPYGRKRALELATTLALDPPVLLFDEPMAGMGVEDIGRISQLIRRVSEGRTIVMVEHNLNVVADLCDHVTVLARGEILAEGDYDTVAADARVREAYMGSEEDA